MKNTSTQKRIIATIMAAAFCAAVILSIAYTAGPTGGYTNSPADAMNCTACHTGTAEAKTGWITSNIPGSGYVPGATYSLTATVTKAGSTKFGFQLSPQKQDGTLLGTLAAGTGSSIYNTKYVQHTASGVSGTDSKSWTFNWTAPAAGSGTVNFYASLLAADNDNSPAGDNTYTSVLTVSEMQPLAATATGVNATCNNVCNGSATANPTGGVSPYTYLWNTTPAQTTKTATGLCTGGASVTITDAAATAVTASVTITQPSAISVSLTSKTDVLCNGLSTGTAAVSASGGTGNLSFAWSNGATGATATALAAGTNTVSVTDANSCVKTFQVTITQPAAIAVSMNTTDASCGANDGIAEAIPSGGTSPYTYIWNTGGVTDTINSLAAGTYTLTITDANNCAKIFQANISNIGAPQITISSQTNVSCNGGNNGAATAVVTGGTPPYSYLWNDPANTAALTVSGLTAGTYSISVTDNLGCQKIETLTITEPAALNVSVAKTNVSCFGANTGTAAATVSGGIAPYNYLWTNGAQTQNIASLQAGNYSVTVTDNSACQANFSVTITQPPALAITMTSTPDSGISNGTATVNVSGGTSPYSYYWSTGADAPDIASLQAGFYSVTVTDGNGCTATNNIVEVSSFVSAKTMAGIFDETKIYPNPFAGNFMIEYTAAEPGTYQFTLFNSTGQQVHNESVNISAGKFNKTISMEENQNGVYILKISGKDKTGFVRIVKF